MEGRSLLKTFYVFSTLLHSSGRFCPRPCLRSPSSSHCWQFISPYGDNVPNRATLFQQKDGVGGKKISTSEMSEVTSQVSGMREEGKADDLLIRFLRQWFYLILCSISVWAYAVFERWEWSYLEVFVFIPVASFILFARKNLK